MSQESRQDTWVIVVTIVICAIAGWTGAAEGAFCSFTLSCITYIPYAALGGILFALPALVVAALLVLSTVYGLRLRLKPISFTILAICMAAIGFACGSMPGIHGQGP